MFRKRSEFEVGIEVASRTSNYQLEEQVVRDPAKQVDLINKRVEEVVRNARADRFRERIESLLLLQTL